MSRQHEHHGQRDDRNRGHHADDQLRMPNVSGSQPMPKLLIFSG
jgi:hypothetical protein